MNKHRDTQSMMLYTKIFHDHDHHMTRIRSRRRGFHVLSIVRNTLHHCHHHRHHRHHHRHHHHHHCPRHHQRLTVSCVCLVSKGLCRFLLTQSKMQLSGTRQDENSLRAVFHNTGVLLAKTTPVVRRPPTVRETRASVPVFPVQSFL